MSKRRTSGEGSLFFRESKKLWVTSMYLPQPDGTKKRQYRYFKTKKEALNYLTELRHDLMIGKPVLCDDYTFGSYLTHWYDTYCIDIRDSTRMSYHTAIFRHVGEHPISQIPLQKLTTDVLQAFFNHLSVEGSLDTPTPKGLSPKTVRNIFNVLHSALDQAVGQKILWSNPCDFVKLAKNQPKDIDFLTVPEMQQLLRVSQGESYRIGLILMTFCGLRIGELLSLTHDDIKFDPELDCYYLNINKGLYRVTDFNSTGKKRTLLRIGPPKTRTSIRQIPLLPEVAAELHRHMTTQKETFGNCDAMYLICRKNENCYIDPSTFRNWLGKMAKKAGITNKKVYPHLLRHTFASQSLKNGMQLEEISKLLGHTDTAFSSRTYVHSDLEGRNNAMSKLEGMAHCLLEENKL